MKSSFVKFLSQFELSKETSLQLLINLFGPNNNLRFSNKKNVEILKVLTPKLGTSEVDKYLKYLFGILEKPNVNEFFPKNGFI